METAICTVGYPGAGTHVATEAAARHGLPVVSMGKRVRERAKAALGDRLTTVDTAASDIVGEWATEQREQEGRDVVARWTLAHVAAELNDQTVLIDGLRSPEAYEQFRETFDNVLLIHIDAPRTARLQRLRAEAGPDETPFTEAALDRRDEREQAWGIDALIEHADVTVQHDSDDTEACVETISDHIETFLKTTSGAN